MTLDPSVLINLMQQAMKSAKQHAEAIEISGPSQAIALKYDESKPDYSLIPKSAMDAIARVLTFGANKYGRHNWRAGNGLEYSRLIAACLRHVTSFCEGEDLDPESGDNHIAHALCCLAFLMTEIDNKTGIDDRFKGENK